MTWFRREKPQPKAPFNPNTQAGEFDDNFGLLAERTEAEVVWDPYKDDLNQITVSELAPPQTDARVYFKQTWLQKQAAEIYPNSDYPWEAAQDIFVYGNEKYKVACAMIDDREQEDVKKRNSLLLTFSSGEKNKISIHITNEISSNLRNVIYDLCKDVFARLNSQQVELFAQSLQNSIHLLIGQELVVSKIILAELVLSVIPNTLEDTSDSYFNFPQATQDQEKKLNQLLNIARKKLSSAMFNIKYEHWHKELNGSLDSFGSDFDYYLDKILRFVLDAREDTEFDFSKIITPEVAEFDIRPQIKRNLSSPAELTEVLSQLPFERKPHYFNILKGSRRKAEMVNLDQVIGADTSHGHKWTISDSSDRGITKIWELVQGLSDGTIDIAGQDGINPIDLVKYEGRYYIRMDGRHRVAALKALGVKQIPATVTHLS